MPKTDGRSKRSLWNDENYVTAYKLARQGHTNQGVAAALGVRDNVFNTWRKKYPALDKALEEGRERREQHWFEEYTYEHLSPASRKVWAAIMRHKTGRTSHAKLVAMLEGQGERVRMEVFLRAMIVCNFKHTAACKLAHVSYAQIKTWESNPQFNDLLSELEWVKQNFYEDRLLDLVADGHPHAIIHANKTFNSKRGYSDKVEIEHTGTVEHNHNIINVLQLDLSPECRKEILAAYRAQEQADKLLEANTVEAVQ